jgi:hypothetical protein
VAACGAGAAAVLRYAYEFEEREGAGNWIDNGHEMHKYLADALGSFATPRRHPPHNGWSR